MRTFPRSFAALLALAGPAAAQIVLSTGRGDGVGDFFGQAVAGGLDLSGDAVPDLVVGAIEPHPLAPGPGYVRAIDGASGAILWTRPGAAVLEHFGAKVALVPDQDGDGRAEVLAAAPRADSSAGVVRLLSGSDGAVRASWHGTAADSALGSAIAAVGDLDQDGVGDFALGAPGTSASAGRVLVISGANGATLLDRPGDFAGDRFGATIAPLHDVDGDGTADLLVGAPGFDAGGADTGAALAISTATGAILRTWTGGVAGSSFGATLGLLGDVDGDGMPEVVVGAWTDPGSTPGLQPGSVSVIATATGAVLYRRIGVTADDYLGRALAVVGDFDGDGAADWAAFARHDVDNQHPGAVFVHSGRTGAIVRVLYGDADQDSHGLALARAGDLDGDGFADLLAGAPEPYHGTPGTGYVHAWRGGPGRIVPEGGSCWTPPSPRPSLRVLVQPIVPASAQFVVRDGAPNGTALVVVARAPTPFAPAGACSVISTSILAVVWIPLDASGDGARHALLPLAPSTLPAVWLQALVRDAAGARAATFQWLVALR